MSVYIFIHTNVDIYTYTQNLQKPPSVLKLSLEPGIVSPAYATSTGEVRQENQEFKARLGDTASQRPA